MTRVLICVETVPMLSVSIKSGWNVSRFISGSLLALISTGEFVEETLKNIDTLV